MQSRTFDKESVTHALLLSACSGVNAAVIPEQVAKSANALDARAGNAYRIAVYQNPQCTGDAIS
jgi:hypothetical protein